MDAEYERNFRRDLEAAGEAQVRADFYSGGGLSTGGEDRRTVIRQWLREQEQKRESREDGTYRIGKRTFWLGIAALLLTAGGVVVAFLHK
jgi:hypothetical protein